MSALATAQAEAPFVSESDLLVVSRDDQADSLKTKMLREEVTLTAAVKVLTTYKVVTRAQYLEFAHQPGATGSVTIKSRGVCLWEIEPRYAGVVTLPRGELVYLIRPDLRVSGARDHNFSRRSPALHLQSSQSWKTFCQGQPLVFEGLAATQIHRPAPEQFKISCLRTGEMVSAHIDYDRDEVEQRRPEQRRDPGPRKDVSSYNALFKGVRLVLFSGNFSTADPAGQPGVLHLYGCPELEPDGRYRLTWACWPIGADEATEISCEFELTDPSTYRDGEF